MTLAERPTSYCYIAGWELGEEMQKMKCPRTYADDDGESHFADLDIPLNPV
jgi:hypothetical protein